MKIATMTTLALMIGSAAHGELKQIAPDTAVTVCVPLQNPLMTPGALAFASMRASRIFHDVGVEIQWVNGIRHCPAQSILLDISYRTPATLQPGALAYALPFGEDKHISILYDRIARDHTKSQVPTVLAYVLVHEITHILQGADRHSATGIMKARWTRKDFAAMPCESLYFEDEDLTWIERGLKWRARRNRVAANVPVAGE
jgi:hypothetical protein